MAAQSPGSGSSPLRKLRTVIDEACRLLLSLRKNEEQFLPVTFHSNLALGAKLLSELNANLADSLIRLSELAPDLERDMDAGDGLIDGVVQPRLVAGQLHRSACRAIVATATNVKKAIPGTIEDLKELQDLAEGKKSLPPFRSVAGTWQGIRSAVAPSLLDAETLAQLQAWAWSEIQKAGQTTSAAEDPRVNPIIRTKRGHLRKPVRRVLAAYDETSFFTQEETAKSLRCRREEVAAFTPHLCAEGLLEQKPGGGMRRTPKGSAELRSTLG